MATNEATLTETDPLAFDEARTNDTAVEPGTVADPEAYEQAKAEGQIGELETDETAQAKPVEYDATARQRIPALLPTEAGALPITLIFEPQPHNQPFDKLLAEYTRRLSALPVTDTAEDEGEARTLAQLDAAGWLFDQVIVDVEGIGIEGEEKPANWLEFFTPQEKNAVVLNAILSGYALPEAAHSGARLSWQSLAGSVTRLRVLFDGRELDVRHTLKKADTKTLREFGALLDKIQAGANAVNLMFELVTVYNRLQLTTHGYKGGIVPAHHRAFAVLAHLTRQLQVTRKN
jgi:hypothetical protein